jgi:serine/threonine protein kinase
VRCVDVVSILITSHTDLHARQSARRHVADVAQSLVAPVHHLVDAGVCRVRRDRCNARCHQIVAAVFYLVSGDFAIYHRDLKPANVLVTQDWSLKLCDFDTARYDASASLDGPLVGSPAYLAPELFSEHVRVGVARAHVCDRVSQVLYNEKCDVYAIGIMLNELVGRCIDGVHTVPYSGEYVCGVRARARVCVCRCLLLSVCAGKELPPTQFGALIAAASNNARPAIRRVSILSKVSDYRA